MTTTYLLHPTSLGTMAEVIMTDEGLEGSRFAADVLKLRGRGAKREAYVQYHTLFDEDIGKAEVEHESSGGARAGAGVGGRAGARAGARAGGRANAEPTPSGGKQTAGRGDS